LEKEACENLLSSWSKFRQCSVVCVGKQQEFWFSGLKADALQCNKIV